ncbi:MAG TPA: hypothetical protein VGI50_15225 [Solirubrobacteraceae bacterium]
MRRRSWFAVTAVMASSLAVGVGLAVAAPPKATKLYCNMQLTTTPPAGSSTVNQPSSQGSQYGPVHCPRAGFGGGVMSDSFTVPDNGNTMGTYTQYFSAGSIRGTFVLEPQESSGISVTNFESQSWLGTVKITGGTGIYHGIKSVRAPGMMTCTSPDSVHLTCTEKVKAFVPPTA